MKKRTVLFPLLVLGLLTACSNKPSKPSPTATASPSGQTTTPSTTPSGQTPTPSATNSKSLALNVTNKTLRVDEFFQLIVTTIVEDESSIAWSVDSGNAVIDKSSGMSVIVTAIHTGSATITAVDLNTGYSGSCKLVITNSTSINPTPTPSVTTDPTNPVTPTPSVTPTITTGPSIPVTPTPSSPVTTPTPSETLPAIDYVKVFCDSSEYSYAYAWIDNNGKVTELLGKWPGTKMSKYDDNWLTYDFVDYTSFNLIFNNNGGSQTETLVISHAGYYWYYQGSLVTEKPKTDEHGHYLPPTNIPKGNYEVVNEAKTASDLPAVKNYDKGEVLYPYKGSRTDFRDESIYFTITTRFYDGDSTNNTKCWDGKNNAADDPAWRGDFKGLIQKMDYIKALGFTAIWITPVVKNASGYDYHGYHAINFKEVDPRYLSEDVDFADVIKEAHKRDMKIVLDVVFNHTGNFGEENLFPMFYYDSKNNTTIKGIIRNPESGILGDNYDSMNGNSQYSARIDAMKGGKDAYNIYHHEKSMAYEQYIEQTGQMAGDCVDLNTENPTVANYLVDAYGEFIRLGVDAFRIDTMKHISRLTFNNYIWPGLYSIAEKCGNKYFYMFGEVCTRVREVWNHGQACDSAPFYTWKESKTYPWGDRATNEASTLQNWNDNSNTNQPTSNNAKLNGLTYHTPDYSKSSRVGVIDFPMHWNFQHASDAYGVAVNNDHVYNDATYNVVYVDSHDYGPDGQEKIRYNEGTSAWKENMSLMFTFRGIPCIYYGSEIEFQKGKTIDEGPNLALKDSGRAYFGQHLEGSVTATDFGKYTASGTVQTTLNSTLSKHLQMLNKIRLKVPALRKGQYNTSNANGNFAYIRRYTSGNIDSLACVAVSGGASFSGLPSGSYVDLVTGTRVNVSSGSLNVNLSGQGSVAVYVLENSSTGTLGKIS